MIPFVAAALLFGAALLALLWWAQERVAYQPQGPPYPSVTDVRRFDYRASDGQPLFAYLVGDPDSARGVLIVFHGNADLAAWQIGWARQAARETGYAVFLPEYRGYMGLSGRPTYAGTLADAHAAYAFVRDSLRVAEGEVALFGHSLGSAIAVEIAARHPPRAVLLQSPFTSTHEMVSRIVTRPVAWAWRPLSRIPYDVTERVKSLDAPVHIAHGVRDGIIPSAMGRAVFAAAKVKGELLLVEQAGHNDVVDVGGERYWRWVGSALASSGMDGLSPNPRPPQGAPSPTR